MKRLLLTLFPVAGAALALDELAFRLQPEDTLEKRFETQLELRADVVHISGSRAGEEMEHDQPLACRATRREHAELEDRYVTVEDGRPVELVRAFGDAQRETQLELQGSPMPPSGSVSDFEDRDVRLARADDDTLEAAFADGGDDEAADLLERLRLDTDFVFLLPAGDASVGDTWTVSGDHLPDLVAPAGDLHPFVVPDEPVERPTTLESVNLNAPLAGMTLAAGELLGVLAGDFEAELVQREEEGEAELAVIEVRLDVEGTLDPTARFGRDVAKGVPEGVPFEYDHEVLVRLEGTGRLRWHLAKRTAARFPARGRGRHRRDDRPLLALPAPEDGRDHRRRAAHGGRVGGHVPEPRVRAGRALGAAGDAGHRVAPRVARCGPPIRRAGSGSRDPAHPIRRFPQAGTTLRRSGARFRRPRTRILRDPAAGNPGTTRPRHRPRFRFLAPWALPSRPARGPGRRAVPWRPRGFVR